MHSLSYRHDYGTLDRSSVGKLSMIASPSWHMKAEFGVT